MPGVLISPYATTSSLRARVVPSGIDDLLAVSAAMIGPRLEIKGFTRTRRAPKAEEIGSGTAPNWTNNMTRRAPRSKRSATAGAAGRPHLARFLQVAELDPRPGRRNHRGDPPAALHRRRHGR